MRQRFSLCGWDTEEKRRVLESHSPTGGHTCSDLSSPSRPHLSGTQPGTKPSLQGPLGHSGPQLQHGACPSYCLSLMVSCSLSHPPCLYWLAWCKFCGFIRIMYYWQTKISLQTSNVFCLYVHLSRGCVACWRWLSWRRVTLMLQVPGQSPGHCLSLTSLTEPETQWRKTFCSKQMSSFYTSTASGRRI